MNAAPIIITPDYAAQRSSGLIDVRDYLNPGASLPNDGIADAQPLIQAAVNDAASKGSPKQVFLPAGSYRLRIEITWKSGVGLKGAGQHDTVLLAGTSQSAIRGTGTVGSTEFQDCVFEDFTIDGAAQTGGGSAAKGFFITVMRRAHFRRVSVLNTWMTGFGLDYLIEATFADCYAENCGRGGGTPANGAGAGFGIGTGGYPVESVTIINCMSNNNKTNGFFTERLGAAQPHAPQGFRLIGCSAAGNYNGFVDSGNTGALVIGNHFIDNAQSGISLRRSYDGTRSGRNGLITSNVLARNGVTVATAGGNGLYIRTIDEGGYRIVDNLIVDNRAAGVFIDGVAVIEGQLVIRNNDISRNGSSGILSPMTGNLERLVVADNDLTDNGAEEGTYQDGMTFLGPLNEPTITGNSAHDTRGSGQTQLYGIALRGASVTTVAPLIARNDLRGNGTDALVQQHIVADATLIADNAGAA